MLIRFEVSNFRSVHESVELSMVAVDAGRPEATEVANLGESLLHVAAIFGPNASGKSNIIAAFNWLRDAVQLSLRTWDHTIPVEPFAFAGGAEEPSGFTVESVIDGVRFEYVLELDRHAVSYEGLFHYPEKKRRRIFERDGAELKLQRGLGSLSGTRELLTDRTLALSAARRFDEPLVSGFANNLLRTQTLGLKTHDRRRPIDRRPTRSLFEHETEQSQDALFDLEESDDSSRSDRAQALAMLRLADLGIEDVVVDDLDDSVGGARIRRLRLTHRTAGGAVPLDFSAESEGTRTWFRLIGPVLAALKSGSVLLIDELDASLHPTLSGELIRLFQDRATNPRNGQLIFTSHDTSLLNHLNRDEVWLTEKSASGASRLGALAEFAGERVRTSVNLEKAYLHGRFGALPDTDRTDLLRVLGLIG
ncbi:AAA family ATPase [Kribbella sp. NPDC051718]|uniref:AAA family ATPase n=1 Tax=Kribbella sp. NPDC051718 TaxID=3155168 RepID=UPI0034328995